MLSESEVDYNNSSNRKEHEDSEQCPGTLGVTEGVVAKDVVYLTSLWLRHLLGDTIQETLASVSLRAYVTEVPDIDRERVDIAETTTREHE